MEPVTASRFAIMALAPQQWHAQWVNRQQLLSRVGRLHTVLYSTGGWFVWDRASPEWREAAWLGRITAADNVWLDESPRYVMRWPKIRSLDQAVIRAQARRWRSWLKRNESGPLVAHICHPTYLPYVKYLRADYLVYHVYDLYDHLPGWRPEWAEFENELLQEADLAFAASEPMARVLQERSNRKVEVLLNGADVEAFSNASAKAVAAPGDLAAIPHPRIGWVGSLHPYINYGLIARLARRMPAWHFVFVGNKVPYTESQAEAEYQECARLPNVHFLGYKHRSEVPAYVANMDVNIICYRMDEARWHSVAYPLKLHEYLASGRPVVSVPLRTLTGHGDVIRFALDDSEWESAIHEAITSGGVGTAKARIAVARQHSWDARAAELLGWISSLPSRRSERLACQAGSRAIQPTFS